MKKSEFLTITCPHCGKTFSAPLDELRSLNSVLHGGGSGTGKIENAQRYRILCPHDDKAFIIDISEDGGVQTYLQGDSTTAAPPPDARKKKKRK